MQLRKQIPSAKAIGPLTTATRIIKREGFFSLYKGLTAVYTGIIPKMSVRFMSFEQYKIGLGDNVPYPLGRDERGEFTQGTVFTAGELTQHVTSHKHAPR